jgi:alginate O-acetyltransferase complex protein AlgI
MLFNSLNFAIFLSLFFFAYQALRKRVTARNVLILGGSYLFYGCWDLRFLLLIVISTAVDYLAAIMIERGRVSGRVRAATSGYVLLGAMFFVGVDWSGGLLAPKVLATSQAGWIVGICGVATVLANIIYPLVARLDETARRKVCLTLSIVANLGILATFKYFDFFASSLSSLAESTFGVTPSDWTLGFVLPVGISFYTFQTMSYSIDVYRRKTRARDRFLEVAAYVAFFPQLVAGPIERASQLLPQFHEVRPRLDLARFRRGAWLIVWGLFKKIVVADNMAIVVNATFGPFDQGNFELPPDGLTLLVALYAFAFQIYGDFSGYTDIARGVAKLLGFDLMRNFDLPYFATSPSDFWRRWHISLSSWFRDYLYIPLGGNKGGPWRTYRNLTITMLLGGLWHGAAWNFVIWGAYHGVLLSIYRALGIRTEEGKYPRVVILLLGVVMFHLTCFGWLLFRAQNLGTIAAFLEGVVLHPVASEQTWIDFLLVFKFGWFLVLFQVLQAITQTQDPLRRWHWFIRLNVWIFVFMSLLALSASGGQEFIYFAF